MQKNAQLVLPYCLPTFAYFAHFVHMFLCFCWIVPIGSCLLGENKNRRQRLCSWAAVLQPPLVVTPAVEALRKDAQEAVAQAAEVQ